MSIVSPQLPQYCVPAIAAIDLLTLGGINLDSGENLSGQSKDISVVELIHPTTLGCGKRRFDRQHRVRRVRVERR